MPSSPEESVRLTSSFLSNRSEKHGIWLDIYNLFFSKILFSLEESLFSSQKKKLDPNKGGGGREMKL